MAYQYDGSVVFAAYRFLFPCNDALETEIHSLMHGMALSIQHMDLSVTVQSMALSTLVDDYLDRSTHGHLALEIKALMVDREFVPNKLLRDQNRVAYCLARCRRTKQTTAVWLHIGPPCIEELFPLDCNSTIQK